MKHPNLTTARRLLALLLVLCSLLAFTACGDEPAQGTEVPAKPNQPGVTGQTVVTVENELGNPLKDVQVYVYTDDTQANLVSFATTDAEGKAACTTEGEGNVAVLSGTAPGYKLEKSYPLTGAETTIVLPALAATEDGKLPADVKFDLGDPMVDFTLTDLEGNTYTASQVLKEKKALVLNFWFTTCGPCAAEFPYLQKAYDAYKDSVALLAVDPYETDDADKITAFRTQHKLTFPMVDADIAWQSALNITAYPTTIIIDRYGFIAYYHMGTVTEEGVFEKLFAYYGAEEYQQLVTDDIDELPLTEEEKPKEDEDGLIYDNKKEPIEIGGKLSFEAKIPAGKTTYYDVYKVGGTYLTIKNENISVEYDGKTYEPKNGMISFPVETDDVTIPVKLAITNKGEETAAFDVKFSYPAGTLDNPLSLKMGDFTTEVKKGNDKGVVYEYKATKNGTVSMYIVSTTKGVKSGFSLFNKRNSAMRNSDEDATGSKNTVSIDVKKGDVLQVTVSVLPNEKNEYPAATIKSHISFKETSGPTTQPTKAMVTYKVTVKSGSKALSNVKLVFTAGKTTKTIKTNSMGVASLKVRETDCTVKLTCPKGYIAEALQYKLTDASPSLVIKLTKEEQHSTEVGDTPTDYSVKVVDGSGKAQKSITVSYYLGDKKVKSVKTNSKGIAAATLMDGTYTIKLSGTTLKYDAKSAFVSVAKPSIEILLAKEMGTAKEKITCPVVEKSRAAYVVKEGATYVTVKPGERSYFLFTPDRNGVFRISASSSYAKVGYYGGSVHFIQTANLAENLENNAFTVEVKDVGPTFVIGVDAATNIDATVLLITRVGDPGWSVADEPWHTYKNTHTPKSYTLPKDTTLKAMDITKTYKLVYNSTDGYYHKDTKNGPIVYLRFGSKSPYVAFADILANFHISAYLYDSAGNFLKKEEYTEAMTAYNNCVDKSETVYPLTKDLEYIVKSYGEHQGWWNPESPGYLFKDGDGNPLPNINLDTAWMFALCYAN